MSWRIGLKASSFEISSLALDQRGISTTMLRIVRSSLAKRGMSWKGETTLPSFSLKTRYSVKPNREGGQERVS